MSTATSKKKGALFGLLAAVIAFALVALAFVGLPAVITATAPPAAVACVNVQNAPAFLAYDAKTRGDNFGPSGQATTVEQAQAELHQRRCTDAALVTAHAAYYGVDGLSLPMSQNVFEQAVQAALDAPATVWRARVTAVEAYEASGNLSMATSHAQYDTLFFLTGEDASVVPDLVAGPVGDRVSTLFVVRHGNVTKNLKLECGFQPFEPKFPGTPKKPHKPHHPTDECVKADHKQPHPDYVWSQRLCKWFPPKVVNVQRCDLVANQVVWVTETQAQDPRYTSDLSKCSKTPPPPPPTTPPTTPPSTPSCPPGQHGKPPICKDGPERDPQAQGNVPTQLVQTTPAADNASEVAKPAEKPVDSGNGIPEGSSPRATPTATPTPAPTLAPPTEAPQPASGAPSSTVPATGTPSDF